MPSLCFDWQGEWLLLFNYLIPFSEQLDQSGQALDCEGGGARVNIKTEQVRGIEMNWSSINRKPQKTCAKPKSAVQMLVSLMYLFVFLRSVNFSCLSVKTSARTTTESMCWGWGCIYCIYSIFRSPFFPPDITYCLSFFLFFNTPPLSRLPRSRCLISSTRCFVVSIC